MHVYVT